MKSEGIVIYTCMVTLKDSLSLAFGMKLVVCLLKSVFALGPGIESETILDRTCLIHMRT